MFLHLLFLCITGYCDWFENRRCESIRGCTAHNPQRWRLKFNFAMLIILPRSYRFFSVSSHYVIFVNYLVMCIVLQKTLYLNRTIASNIRYAIIFLIIIMSLMCSLREDDEISINWDYWILNSFMHIWWFFLFYHSNFWFRMWISFCRRFIFKPFPSITILRDPVARCVFCDR